MVILKYFCKIYITYLGLKRKAEIASAVASQCVSDIRFTGFNFGKVNVNILCKTEVPSHFLFNTRRLLRKARP